MGSVKTGIFPRTWALLGDGRASARVRAPAAHGDRGELLATFLEVDVAPARIPSGIASPLCAAIYIYLSIYLSICIYLYLSVSIYLCRRGRPLETSRHDERGVVDAQPAALFWESAQTSCWAAPAPRRRRPRWHERKTRIGT